MAFTKKKRHDHEGLRLRLCVEDEDKKENKKENKKQHTLLELIQQCGLGSDVFYYLSPGNVRHLLLGSKGTRAAVRDGYIFPPTLPEVSMVRFPLFRASLPSCKSVRVAVPAYSNFEGDCRGLCRLELFKAEDAVFTVVTVATYRSQFTLNAACNLGSLTSFCLKNLTIFENFSAFTRCEGLRELTLCNCAHVKNADFKDLPPLTDLRIELCRGPLIATAENQNQNEAPFGSFLATAENQGLRLSLERLSFRNTLQFDPSVFVGLTFPRLLHLDLSALGAFRFDLRRFDRTSFPKLVKLDLAYSKIDGLELVHEIFPLLQDLRVNRTVVTEGAALAIMRLDRLTQFWCTSVSSADVIAILRPKWDYLPYIFFE